MPRSKAHDLLGELATKAYTEKMSFTDVLINNGEIKSHLSVDEIIEASNPRTFIGEIKEIGKKVFDTFHNKKTLAV